MYCIRSTWAMALSMCLLLVSCETTELELTNPQPDDTATVTGSTINFTAHPLGALDYSFTQATDPPAYIEERDRLVFKNLSRLNYNDNTSTAATNVRWTFEGGDPASSTIGDSEITVTYEEIGEYNLALEILGEGGKKETFNGIISVQPIGTIKTYRIELELSDDGLSTLFNYGENGELVEIVKQEDGVTMERSTLVSDEFIRLVNQVFLSGEGELLGTDYWDRNEDGHITSERREDAEGNILYRFDYNLHPDGYALTAEFTGLDNTGTPYTTDINYIYDDNKTEVKEEQHFFEDTLFLSVMWSWDDNPAIWDGMPIVEYAKRFSQNNATSKIQYDGSGAVISMETYGYTYDSFYGGKPISAQIDRDGETSVRTWQFGVHYFF